VKTWGYTDIQVRQLAHNRREVCLIAKDRVKRPEPTVDESSSQDTPLARATEKSPSAEKSADAAHQANDGE
jgi:hypothetical protein